MFQNNVAEKITTHFVFNEYFLKFLPFMG